MTLDLGRSLVALDVVTGAAFVVDFAVASRRTATIVARTPAVVGMAATLVLLPVVERPVEFVATSALVVAAAVFGYANFLAFVKRGITFSILHSRARPRATRPPDREFIALDERLDEMRGHGWVVPDGPAWRLTPQGHRVVRVRRFLLRALGIEAVG